MDNIPEILVRIQSLFQPIPHGWRKLTLAEGHQYKHFLITHLGEWSIVAFDKGKIDGSGYGHKISDTYGEECGEVFTVWDPQVKLHNIHEQIPHGWRALTYHEAKTIKHSLNQHLGQWSIGGFVTGKIDGNGYGNKYSPERGEECGEVFIIEGNYEIIKVHSAAAVPEGFRIMTLEEGTWYKNQLLNHLQEWSIVGFQTGKIDGFGYGNKISHERGNECGEFFYIKY
ncbi:hypothetical protein pb186bvf_000614 [Paramecium bursaria]